MEIIFSSTVIAAIVSAIVTFWTNGKKASAEYVTADRRKWREEIREIAEKLDGANYHETIRQLNRLKVRINAYGEYLFQCERYDSHIWELIHEIEEQKPLGEELQKKQRQMIQYLSLMLKFDWERSKSEIKGDIFGICGWLLVVVSLVGYAFHGYFFKEELLQVNEKYYLILCTAISILAALGMLLAKKIFGYKHHSKKQYKTGILEKFLDCIKEMCVALLSVILFIYLGEVFFKDIELIQNHTGMAFVREMCYILNFTGLLILAMRNIDEIGEERNLIRAIRKIQNPNRKSQKQQWAKQKDAAPKGALIEKKENISKKVVLGCVIAVIAVLVSSLTCNISAAESVLLELLGETSKEAAIVRADEVWNIGGMLENEVTLLLGAVTTLAIITSFLQTRYLGANYKYWFFKERIYYLLPQEMLAIMLSATLGTAVAYLLENTIAAVLCLLVSWWMFLWLHCRIYAAVVKVSRMFEKLEQKLCKGNMETQKKLCDSIYKKLYSDTETAVRHNSYLYEEAGIMLRMLEFYAEYEKQTAEHQQKEELKKKRKKLFEILWNRIHNEAKIMSRNDWIASEAEEEWQLVKNIITKSGKFEVNAEDEKCTAAKNYLWEKLRSLIEG